MQAVGLDGNMHDIQLEEVEWRPSVYGIVIRGDKILLSPQHGLGYDLPGGGMELYESFEQTVIREVKEETGCDVIATENLGAKEILFAWKPENPQERKIQHSILVYYLCKYVGGEISTEGFDEAERYYAQAANWIPLSQLDTITIASTVDWRPIVKDAIRH